jgi:predicted Zn-dependent protease with MMP-like domain
MNEDAAEDLPWEQLFDRADKIIQRTIESLPGPIRDQARKIPTLLERWPPDDEDLLGQCHGFEPDHLSPTLGPIFIFIGPLRLFCEDEKLDFDDELRITYLHELGHFLGVDEDDLDQRGLA